LTRCENSDFLRRYDTSVFSDVVKMNLYTLKMSIPEVGLVDTLVRHEYFLVWS